MKKVFITHLNKEVVIKPEIETYLDLSKEYKDDFNGDIVLVMKDNKLSDLNKKIKPNQRVTFLDTTTTEGYRSARASLAFLFIRSVYKAFEKRPEKITVTVQFSINDGLYCEIKDNESNKLIKLSVEMLDEIRAIMREYIEKDQPFIRRRIPTEEAIDIFRKQGYNDKIHLFKYRSVSNTNIYELDGLSDYFYIYMVPSASYLSVFEIYLYNQGLIIQFPSKINPKRVAEYKPDTMLFNTQKAAVERGKIIGIENVADLNDAMKENTMKELILTTEAFIEKRVADVADKIIAGLPTKKFIFVAGPSSSGKTTFSHRLGIQLKTQGIYSKVISVDNYFVNREMTPKDEEGNFDYESIDAIDIKKFNEDMTDLLEGKKVDLPVYNFIRGEREYKDKHFSLDNHTVLIIEGIHCLNDKLSQAIASENKFKIYISCLTQLNIDNHNRIPTTDTRLLRRIVRDFRYRGNTASQTIAMWPSVRRGEEKYIFPFQEEADVMFNSSHIYELSILKQYAEPLLYSVLNTEAEFLEAKRLIKFLEYFLGYSSEDVPRNSILREFIGKSTFR